MNNMIAWQIVRKSQLRLSHRFFKALFLHYISTFQPQADPRKRVDTVINTIVAWLIAACHSAVCGIDNSTAFQRGNVALPQINIALSG